MPVRRRGAWLTHLDADVTEPRPAIDGRRSRIRLALTARSASSWVQSSATVKGVRCAGANQGVAEDRAPWRRIVSGVVPAAQMQAAAVTKT